MATNHRLVSCFCEALYTGNHYTVRNWPQEPTAQENVFFPLFNIKLGLIKTVETG